MGIGSGTDDRRPGGGAAAVAATTGARPARPPVADYGDALHCRIVRETFARVGDKWSLLVIAILSTGPQRFSVLKAATAGISQRMLTVTLRSLERDGLVRRTVFPEVPPRVEYALTPLGASMTGPVTALADWAVAAWEAVAASQAAYDAGRGREPGPRQDPGAEVA